MFHMSQQIIKTSAPGVGDVLKQNPELMASVMKAMVGQMGGAAGGLGGGLMPAGSAPTAPPPPPPEAPKAPAAGREAPPAPYRMQPPPIPAIGLFNMFQNSPVPTGLLSDVAGALSGEKANLGSGLDGLIDMNMNAARELPFPPPQPQQSMVEAPRRPDSPALSVPEMPDFAIPAVPPSEFAPEDDHNERRIVIDEDGGRRKTRGQRKKKIDGDE